MSGRWPRPPASRPRCGYPSPAHPAPGSRSPPAICSGGAGDDAELAALFRAALGRARERGLQHVVAFHDERDRPPWLRAAIQVPETYLLMARPLAASGPATALGDRAVAVDPLDM